MTESASRGAIDLPTLIGVAATVCIGSTLLHEAVGHGGACLLVGAHPRALGAYYFDCDTAGLSPWHFRVVAAAGSTMNAAAALLAFLVLRQGAGMAGAARIFWWLVFSVNAMQWAGYYAFSGVSGVGDWGTSPDAVLDGVPYPWLWRAGLTVVGVALYILVTRRAAGFLAGLVGDGPDRLATARRLTLTPYLTAGTVAMLVSAFNPVGWYIVLASAAASSFGGLAGLLRMPGVLPGGVVGGWVGLRRSVVWIVVGFLVVATFCAVAGPTIRFR